MSGNAIGSKADDLEERFIKFAVEVIKVSNTIFGTHAGRHIAGQLLRSGTSPAANYGEARGAESDADFVHKLRIVLKELNETSVWLRIAANSGLIKMGEPGILLDECSQLARIVNTSIGAVRHRISNGTRKRRGRSQLAPDP